jgi:hypothetical protein
MPHDGEPASVQVAGCHGHEHEHDDGAPTAPRHGDACCDDVPLDRSVPGAAVVVPGLAATAATSWVASLPVAPNGPARAVAHAAPPRERGLVVLLR